MKRRTICVVLIDRANYGRLKPVMRAIQDHPDLKLQVIAAGSMVLARFGHPVDVVRADGFSVDGEIFTELEGSTPTTMAKSVGYGVVEFASEFQRLKPDLVLLIGDRYEALSAAIAAAYTNLCVVHVQGGEVSGSIDESARHAISKFAQFHFPATARSADYLIRMGENPSSILGIGCPSSDIAREIDLHLDMETVNGTGSGANIDVTKPFLLVIFHPTTTRYGGEQRQMEELLTTLESIAMPTILLWPNIDAGSDQISKAIRVFRDLNGPRWLRTLTNLMPEAYLRVLGSAACAVGNSSSFVRDASYFGTPVVLIGDRQEGREHDVHAIQVPPVQNELRGAILAQIDHGPYKPSTLYGDGTVSARLAESLARLNPYIQKQLHYVREEGSFAAAPAELSGIYASTGHHSSSRRLQRNPAEEYRAATR